MDTDFSSSPSRLDSNSNAVKNDPSSPSFHFGESNPPADNVTMAQIANARETFSDLESAYRKFKLELDGVKEEHRHEVCWNSYFTSMIVSDLVPASQELICIRTLLKSKFASVGHIVHIRNNVSES